MTSRRFTVPSALQSFLRYTRLASLAARVHASVTAFLSRRPHRSFQLTRRRDYVRSLELPGYWRFSSYVWKTLWSNRKLFGLLALVYAGLTLLLVGITSQEAYSETTGALREVGDEIFTGGLTVLEQASLVFLSTVSGGLNGEVNAAHQAYAGLIGLLTWLTTVWLLRAISAGQAPRLRDGLYNAGAPVVSTFLVSLVLVVQLLPLALVGLGYSAAVASGLLDGGIEAMLFWSAAILLTVLALYWATSTFLALVIVTLPGMYPMKALRTAGDLVVGRRARIVLRLLWVGVLTAILWALILIPVIIADAWLKGVLPAVEWLPIVPVTILLMGSVTIVTLAAYVYLLYRKVVQDDAAPATN